MSRRTERILLPPTGFGTAASLTVHRFGRPGARPRAYLQAGLHADELPGLLVLHHLARLLERAGEAVTGEAVLLPVANPPGLGQYVAGRHLGRYDLAGLGNFNRDFPDLTDAAAARLDGRLGADPHENRARVQAALADAAAALPAPAGPAGLKVRLLQLAAGADIVLDLHADDDALVHLYTVDDAWPAAADLAGWSGAAAVLLARESGGEPFDEALSRPWWRLAERFGPACPLPAGCLAATLELRGENDVAEAQAIADAGRLFRFLQGRGVVAGDPGPAPAAVPATPLAGVEMLRAPRPGLLSWHAAPGDRLRRGQPVCDLIDPVEGERTTLGAGTDGLLFARRRDRLARPGDIVAKLAGPAPLAGRTGRLLTD